MKCPRCRSMAPDGVSFCPNCGNDLRLFQQSPAKSQQVPVKEQMRKSAATSAAPAGYYQKPAAAGTVGVGSVALPSTARKIKPAYIIAGILALLLLGFGFMAMNALGKKGRSQGAMLNKTGILGGPMLDKTAKINPMMDQVAQAPGEMPADILRWLRHLQECEERRAKLTNKFISNVMSMMPGGQFGTDMTSLKNLATGDPDAPEPKAAPDALTESSVEMSKGYEELKAYFETKPPPQSCQTIADAYNRTLDETGAMFGDFQDAMNGWSENMNASITKLNDMKNKSESINKYGGETDQLVQDICDKYNKKKWFSINKDFGQSGSLGMMGFR